MTRHLAYLTGEQATLSGRGLSHYTALDDATGQKHIANTVIASVGDVYGVISSDAFRRLSQIKDAPAGYLCILMSFDYLKSRNADQRPAVGQCLDGLIAENPDDASLSSLKAIVLVRDYLDATSQQPGRRRASARSEAGASGL